ncbi:hypothetical protein BBD42_17265 [Paenibacillus sp. BIHB 4019]|uniref:Uncharacterized protein n=1 Tax=Paenibacillus sp. BIHB 4019 TaxID=1870819 RepID=A0A1B2DJX7_9BACL|nr:hypothetical protein [Paenibacillus sp. BIHB 4019]ANY68030.1 hypothetical protein BBD42_17265 [Paenibacillus sp. BIHB 4019]
MKQFLLKEDPFEKAVEGFWLYANSWLADEPEEFFAAFRTFDLSSIQLEREKIAYVIHYRFNEPIEFVQTTLNVYLNGKYTAFYHFLQKLDGEGMDDSISFKI